MEKLKLGRRSEQHVFPAIGPLIRQIIKLRSGRPEVRPIRSIAAMDADPTRIVLPSCPRRPRDTRMFESRPALNPDAASKTPGVLNDRRSRPVEQPYSR